ncbi:serine/threonine-protein kinase HAL4/sat4 [Paraconiothyrium brasiliense]|uniref:non-specific serine/threonine protein kinase n=1 Tax=Paraconiothyrium brasiliense TaxID=300254 RepID=A0ABR3R1W0_9PLEO
MAVGMYRHSFPLTNSNLLQNKNPDRIKYHVNGDHEHHLANIVRLYDNNSTITRFIRWIKKGNQAVPSDRIPLAIDFDIFSTAASGESIESKYGRYKEVLGWGSSSTVKLSYKSNPHHGPKGYTYAVKAFRRRANESQTAYHKRASAEFCIASTLQHKNIVHTIELLSDDHGRMCQVMEFCAAGDLCAILISAGKLDETEADCLFKQLMRGVAYCHQMGVAHRDLKPENILLTTMGCLKISDFGMAECVQYAWEKTGHRSKGLQGSKPYQAPEAHTTQRFDARAIDVWATGIIYVAMRTAHLMWSKAESTDAGFNKFLVSCGSGEGYRPIEQFEGVSREVTQDPHPLTILLPGTPAAASIFNPTAGPPEEDHELADLGVAMVLGYYSLQSWPMWVTMYAIEQLRWNSSPLFALLAFAYHVFLLTGSTHLTPETDGYVTYHFSSKLVVGRVHY